jgi:uncharacterized membrane protein
MVNKQSNVLQVLLGLAKVNDKNLFKEIVKALYLYHPHPHTIHTKMEVLNIFKAVFHNLKYFLVLLR